MYDLHNLGWHSFQQLCLTILREVLGQTVQSFLDTNDGGRDGAFVGQWRVIGGEALRGQFVVQCKFTSRVGYTLSASDLSDELAKIEKLVAHGRCDCYVLMTNAGLSGNQDAEIESLIRRAGAKHVLLLGSTWIEQQIRERKRLRMLVPRVYGLGDLSQIFDERAYVQARTILESLHEDLAKVVVTKAYRQAAAAIDEHGFVLLIGEPAAGKSTIASLLAMAAIDQWDSFILKLASPEKLTDHWNPEETSQFFWLDDVFGVTQYEQSLVHGWNHVLPHVKTMLRKGAKIVMTSRDYIYNRARNDLKEGAFPLLCESQVVIDVHELTLDERRQMLYNHIRLGRQPRAFRTDIKPYLEAIATHLRFIPETARRLGEPLFTRDLALATTGLAEFVEKREQLVGEVLRNLDVHSKAALALIFMHKNNLESPVLPQESEEQALKRLGSGLGECITALQSLRGSLVQLVDASGITNWQFKHPTIADAYAAFLGQSPELLGIFVQGSEPAKLIEQVTCGDVGIEQAIVIPSSLFPLMLGKLSELIARPQTLTGHRAAREAERARDRFLARRCNKVFLALYIDSDATFLDRVSKPGRYLNAVSEVPVAVRLHENGLLPEHARKSFVKTVCEYTLDGEDLYALECRDIQSVFQPREFKQLLDDVRTKLLPRLDNVTLEVMCNHSSSDAADAYMQPYLDSLQQLQKHFGADAQTKQLIEREIKKVEDWIGEHYDEETWSAREKLGALEALTPLPHDRSIFDDVDA